MFFLFGWGHQIKRDFGPVLMNKCSHCNNEGYMRLKRISEWFTLFFVPIIPYKIQSYLICPICEYGFQLDGEKYKKFRQIAEINQQFISGKVSENEHIQMLKEASGEAEDENNSKSSRPKEDLICKKCGKGISKDANFCKSCGEQIA